MSSLSDGPSREAAASSISNGATELFPVRPMRTSAARFQHRRRSCCEQFCMRRPPIPETAVPTYRCRQQSQHGTQACSSLKSRTEVMFNEPCREHGLPCIALGRTDGAPAIPGRQKIRRDGCPPWCRNDRHRARDRGDQHAGGHTRQPETATPPGLVRRARLSALPE